MRQRNVRVTDCPQTQISYDVDVDLCEIACWETVPVRLSCVEAVGSPNRKLDVGLRWFQGILKSRRLGSETTKAPDHDKAKAPEGEGTETESRLRCAW